MYTNISHLYENTVTCINSKYVGSDMLHFMIGSQRASGFVFKYLINVCLLCWVNATFVTAVLKLQACV